jgi:hypothetical protein
MGFNSGFKGLRNKAATYKITRGHMAGVIRFALSKALSVEFGVSCFESTGKYPFNRNRVPECLFSISDTSESKTSIDTASSNMTLICVYST